MFLIEQVLSNAYFGLNLIGCNKEGEVIFYKQAEKQNIYMCHFYEYW